MPLFLPRRWRSQPQYPVGIDRSNPLTRGLYAALLPTVGGTLYNAVTGTFLTQTGAAATRRINSKHGIGQRYGDASGTSYQTLTAQTNDAGAIFWLGERQGTGVGVFRDSTSAGGNLVFDSSGGFYVRMGDANAGIVGTFAANTPYNFLYTGDGQGTGQITKSAFYVDGVLLASNWGAWGFIGGPTLYLHENGSGGGAGVDATDYLWLIWNRHVDATQYAALNANPWQVFAPQRRAIFIGGVAGAAQATGDGAATLGALTAAGTATVQVNAAGAATLNALTAAGTATTQANANGGLALAALTAAGGATVQVNAAGAATLDALTSSATATVRANAAGAATLDALTVTGLASGVVSSTGNAAATLAALTSTGAATVQANAAGAATLDALTASGVAGGLASVGTGAATLASLTAAGTATVVATGTAAVQLGTLTLNATATVLVQAAGALAIGPVTTTGAATVRANATSAVTLGDVTAAGNAGSVAMSMGDAAITLDTVQTVGKASFLVIGPGGYGHHPRRAGTVRRPAQIEPGRPGQGN